MPTILPRFVAPVSRRAATLLASCCLGAISAPTCAQENGLIAISASDLMLLDQSLGLVEPIAIGAITPLAESDVPPPPEGEAVFIGPPAAEALANQPAELTMADSATRRDYASFGEDVKAIRWEFAAVAGYYTAINAAKLFKNPRLPRTKKEGWFGRSTNNVGVDKLAHAYSSYVISEILAARLRKKTGGAPGSEVTAAILASGVMAWAEFFDSIEPSGGWSWEDVTFNSLGAGFSALRNSVPGLDKKLDFRLMIEPNNDIYTINGKEHFQQQRYLFALKAAGFKRFERTPLRLVEFHLGYRGDDFLNEDREAGITPKRHIFVGLGLNLRELLFKRPSSRAGRAAGEVLDYFQPPYTAVHTDLTE